MSYYPQSEGEDSYGYGGGYGGGYSSAASSKAKKRRVVNCEEPGEVEVDRFVAQESREDARMKSTVCMSYHVMARLEDDVKRAEIRQNNPESAIPDRGYEYEQEAYRAVAEFRTTQQLPRSARSAAPSLYTPSQQNDGGFLPSLTPSATRSRRGSASTSRQQSRATSLANSPTNRSRNNNSSRSPARGPAAPAAGSYAGQHRSPATSKKLSPRGSSQARTPAGGRLEPIDQADRSPADSDFGVAGRHRGAAGEPHGQTNKQLLLDASELGEEDGDYGAEEDRQRRLRLAEELATQMDLEEA